MNFNLEKVYQKLKNYDKIIVTGPKRSGTTFMSKILSRDLGYDFIDEKEINIDNIILFFDLLRERSKFILQVPCLTYMIH